MKPYLFEKEARILTAVVDNPHSNLTKISRLAEVSYAHVRLTAVKLAELDLIMVDRTTRNTLLSPTKAGEEHARALR